MSTHVTIYMVSSSLTHCILFKVGTVFLGIMSSGSDASLVPNKHLLHTCGKECLCCFPLHHPLYPSVIYPFILSHLSPHWIVRWIKPLFMLPPCTQHRRVFSAQWIQWLKQYKVLISSCHKLLASLFLRYSILYCVYITDS